MSAYDIPLLNVVRGIQSKLIFKSPQTPNIALGIGEAENLKNISDIVYPNGMLINKNVTQPELEDVAYERTMIDGYSQPLTQDDFIKKMGLGESVWE